MAIALYNRTMCLFLNAAKKERGKNLVAFSVYRGGNNNPHTHFFKQLTVFSTPTPKRQLANQRSATMYMGLQLVLFNM